MFLSPSAGHATVLQLTCIYDGMAFANWVTIACTGVRELSGFEVENLSRVPGDA